MTLRDLGIDEYTERVYRATLGHEPATIAELCARLRAEEQAVDTAVTALLDLGLLRATADDRVGALPVAAAVGSLVERREDEAMSRFRRVAATRSDMVELIDLQAARRAAVVEEADLERIEDLQTLRERIEELAFFSRTSLFSIQPGGPQSRESLEASRPLDLRGLRRDVDMRIIHERSVIEDEYNELYLRDIVARGAKVRLTTQSLDRMLIMDGTLAVVPIDPSNSRRGALVVHHPGLVSGFVDLFDRVWEDAAEFPGTTDMTDNSITDEDRRILTLLSGGCTDEMIAREVALSVRHLRRQISRLMLMLNASSRFEAGAAAARRGWV